MIEIEYLDRTGNQLFQYCFARLLALETGHALKAKPIEGFPSTHTEVPGRVLESPILNVHELYGASGSYTNLPKGPYDRVAGRLKLPQLIEHARNYKVNIKGYFEYFGYYAPYVEQIRNEWVIPDPKVQVIEPHPEDLVLHIRRGDMVGLGWTLPWSYFERLLNSIAFRKLFIATDFPEDDFFNSFSPFDPMMISSDFSSPSRTTRGHP